MPNVDALVNLRDKLKLREEAISALRGAQVFAFYKHLTGALMDNVDGAAVAEAIGNALRSAKESSPTPI